MRRLRVFYLLNLVRAQSCQTGYEWANGECVDIDECANESGGGFFDIVDDALCPAEKNYECINTPGSYRCQCQT